MSNVNTRQAPLQNVLDTAITRSLRDVCTAVPGYVVAFIPGTQRAQVQIGLVRVNIDGAIFNPPPIVDVPVQFPGSGFVLEHQVTPGCEGIILFSQRCMDGWKQTGGIADNPVARFHSMQDAMFIPGIRSNGKVISGFANDGIRIRSQDGSQHVWLKGDGSVVMKNGAGAVTLGADGTVNINGVIIDKNGNMTVPNSVKVQGKELANHTHGGVQPGSGNTGANQ